MDHRHLREIDRSSAIVGGPAAAWAMVLNPGANQYTGPAFSAKDCFMVADNITTSVNKGRRAGPMSSLLIKICMVGMLSMEQSAFQLATRGYKKTRLDCFELN